MTPTASGSFTWVAKSRRSWGTKRPIGSTARSAKQKKRRSSSLSPLHLKPGDTVADIGAGSGYLSFLMAKPVGPTGRVYAEDIQPEMLDIVLQEGSHQRAKQRRCVAWKHNRP